MYILSAIRIINVCMYCCNVAVNLHTELWAITFQHILVCTVILKLRHNITVSF